jgi:hypothetical protein
MSDKYYRNSARTSVGYHPPSQRFVSHKVESTCSTNDDESGDRPAQRDPQSIESGDSEETTVWTVLVLFLRILLVRYLA